MITDAHITSLRAILTQGDDLESARTVVTASRTLKADLEVTAIDFTLCRF